MCKRKRSGKKSPLNDLPALFVVSHSVFIEIQSEEMDKSNRFCNEKLY